MEPPSKKSKMRGSNPLYLGIDMSTQSCKALIIDEHLQVLGEAKVHFDTDLPHYGTQDGCYRGEGGRVTSPTRMWIEALELTLDRLKDQGCDFERIVAISGSGQQHGSVYWTPDGVEALQRLDPAQQPKGLRAVEQLGEHCFAVPNSPIWMDTSTSESCREMTKTAGGALLLAEWTGSTAQERFSGHHFRRFIKEHGVERCGAFSLVSSFCASLLVGKVVPIDISDAAGMNLMDIRSKTWRPELLEFVAPKQVEDLRQRLVEPQDSWDVSGKIHRFWAERYGFGCDTDVVAWSGDNPCAVIGNGLIQEGDIAISLGTSDTALSVLSRLPKEPLPFGHLFPHPILRGAYWSMLCYTNGDVTRRKIRDDFFQTSEGSADRWAEFTKALRDTPPGNGGAVGMFFTTDEITPAVCNGKDFLVNISDPRQNARAVIEMRALAIKNHLEKLLPEVTSTTGAKRPPQLLLTGGAAQNPAILQVFADVFQRPVRRVEVSEGAAFGAAVRALHGHKGDALDWEELTMMLLANSKVHAEPNADAAPAYSSAQKVYASLEAQAFSERGRTL